MSNCVSEEQTISPLARHARAVDHVAIAVPSLEDSIGWFTNVLGFKLKERRETKGESSGMVSAVLEAGPLSIVLLEGTYQNRRCRALSNITDLECNTSQFKWRILAD